MITTEHALSCMTERCASPGLSMRPRREAGSAGVKCGLWAIRELNRASWSRYALTAC
jgi:hypothetical protein